MAEETGQGEPGEKGLPPYGRPPAPKPGVIPLRPIGAGEILDGAFTAIRRNPRATLGVGARGEAALVYAAAAAERARAERARVSAELQRRGVIVVDAPPGRLPPALADAYLALKAAGRL